MLGPWTCLVQSESATSSIEEAFNVDSYLTLLVMVIFIASVIIGGLKGISSKMESVVPKLAITYLTVAVILLVMNYDQILPAFALILNRPFHRLPVSADLRGNRDGSHPFRDRRGFIPMMPEPATALWHMRRQQPITRSVSPAGVSARFS